MKHAIRLKVNQQFHEMEIEPWRTLLEVIRDRLELTGTKESCSDGNCGACAVLMDNKVVNACLILAVEAKEKDIQTIEGLATEGILDPIQEAFIEHGAIQCGFCTPGMVTAAKALFCENPSPTEGDIKEAIAGHLCRCTGYFQIIEAIKAAAGQISAENNGKSGREVSQ